jgi:cobalt/nickel transport system permease protein
VRGRGIPLSRSLEDWSRRTSPLHRRDPRAKILATLTLLIALAAEPVGGARELALMAACALALLLATAAVARLPLGEILLRAALVLPFTALFVLLLWFQGDGLRAVTLLVKTYLSALTAVLLTATTPLDRLLAGLRRMGAPAVLVQVIHFIWRYLIVTAEQAGRVRTAAAARGGDRVWRIAAASVASLFASSYQRAERIHRAMLARNASQAWPLLRPLRFSAADGAFVCGAILAALAVRAAGGAL